MLLCDVRNRWQKLDPSRPSFFTTGTDEHGLKIQNVAETAGIPPKQLVDQVSQNFKQLASKLNIKYDRFIRTTDPDHATAVNKLWEIMQLKDLIYKGEHSGWYSVSDETFFPETQIVKTVKDGKEIMISSETKNEVKFHTETNYFFRLSKFQDMLINHLERNPNFVTPVAKYNEILNELKSEKLYDLSVSRPASRLTWGISVPGDESQKIYVWFDALTNYITSCGFPRSFELKSGRYVTSDDNPWGNAVHVIGKDIIRFHCIYWPIFLMAANIDLPQQIMVHSHWLSEGFKMSKSLGNVVDPIQTCETYGEDALRFFLMEHSNINNDSNYSSKYFNFTRDNLIGKYANILTRCGGASFDIAQSVKDLNNGKFEGIEQLIKDKSINSDKVDLILQTKSELIEKLETIQSVMAVHMDNFDNMRAIQEWWLVLELANQFLQFSEPWIYNKKLDQDDDYTTLRNYYILLGCEAMRICSILISPVIPTLSGKLLDRLNVKVHERNFDFLKPFRDITYGEGANGKHELPIKRLKK